MIASSVRLWVSPAKSRGSLGTCPRSVSSATRVAHSVDDRSVHFVDGGYYDNDGTASALEFLRYALAPSVGIDTDVKTLKEETLKERKLEEKGHLESIERKLEKHPLRILLIEIRNSRDTAEDKAVLPTGRHGAAIELAALCSPL